MQTCFVDKTTLQTLNSIFQYFPAPLQGYLIGFIGQEHQFYILNAIRNTGNFTSHQIHTNMFLPYPLQIIGHFYSLSNSTEKITHAKKSNLCICFDKQTKTKQIFIEGKESRFEEVDGTKLLEQFTLYRFRQQFFLPKLEVLSNKVFWSDLLEQIQVGESISLPLQPFTSNINFSGIPKGSIGEFLQQNKLQEASFKSRILIPPLKYIETKTNQPLHEQTDGVELILDLFFYSKEEDWKQAAKQTLQIVSPLLQQQTQSSKQKLVKLGTYPFLPLQSNQIYPHLVTIVYSFLEPLSIINTREEETDPRLTQTRNEIHDVLFLAKQFPFFRITNSLSYHNQDKEQALSILSNLHWFCTRKSTIAMPTKTTLHLIKGHYDFYHYCMDNVKDNGWGCAYRSLQTVISFIKQNYLASRNVLNIPSHAEMQQTLVYLKDKPKQFIESKEWIGMVECSLLLDHYCAIASKIINFSLGKDNLQTLAKQFCTHFDENGSPIMIGGGVLALTCLGIDFDLVTNEVSFLILDPHYVSTTANIRSDMIAYLQDALKHKAISWKTSSQVFQSNNFYNCLLPLIPKTC